MKVFIQKERIRVTPMPKEGGYRLWVWLVKPLTEANQPYVYTDIVPGRKFYDLPCPQDNIMGVTIRPK
jgi:hypothetical protein